MRLSSILFLCSVLAVVGCRKRKLVAPATPEITPQPEAAQTTLAAPAQTQPSGNQAAPADARTVETGVEFGDLNNIIEGFAEFHKRMPTIEELKKSYYGGTKPLPIPPGYKLVIDPKTKKAKLER